MFCENCGNRLEENAKFCTFCGKPVSTITPQGVVLQKNPGEQTSAVQPEQPKVLQKLYGRLTASTALWIIAGVLNIIVLKDNFSYWNLLSKISAIVEIIVVFCVALARFIDRTDIYTNICKIDEDYGEIPSSAGSGINMERFRVFTSNDDHVPDFICGRYLTDQCLCKNAWD